MGCRRKRTGEYILWASKSTDDPSPASDWSAQTLPPTPGELFSLGARESSRYFFQGPGAAPRHMPQRLRGALICGAMNEQAPLPRGVAAQGVIRCIARTVQLFAQRRVRFPRDHLDMRLRFANNTSARVFRETAVDRGPTIDPCVLVVEFRLRLVRGWCHALFRRESLLNTPLFVGFAGFVSKLWLAHDANDTYRGVYEWDGPARAEYYARCLWRILELGCVPGSIHYIVLPGYRRDEVLRQPEVLLHAPPSEDRTAWWRPVAVA